MAVFGFQDHLAQPVTSSEESRLIESGSIFVLCPQFTERWNMNLAFVCPDSKSVEYSIFEIKRTRLNSAGHALRKNKEQAEIHRCLETMRDLLSAGF